MNLKVRKCELPRLRNREKTEEKGAGPQGPVGHHEADQHVHCGSPGSGEGRERGSKNVPRSTTERGAQLRGRAGRVRTGSCVHPLHLRLKRRRNMVENFPDLGTGMHTKTQVG